MNNKKKKILVSVALCTVALGTSVLTQSKNIQNLTVLADDSGVEPQATPSTAIANVSTAQELYNALTDSNITQINVTSDIDMSNAINNKAGTTVTSGRETHNSGNDSYQNNRNLTINSAKNDGSKATVNFDSWNFDYNGNSIITLNNLNLQGNNFYGPVSLKDDSHGVIKYNNISYTGSQLTYAIAGTVEFSGVVRVDSGENYNSSVSVHTNQENIQADNVIFKEGSAYTGTTTNREVIAGASNITLEQNATVTLKPGNSNYAFRGLNNIDLNDSASLDIENNQTPVGQSWLSKFKNNNYSWEMKSSPDSDDEKTDFNQYSTDIKSLKITKNSKNITVNSLNLVGNKNKKIILNFDSILVNVANQDSIAYDLTIKRDDTDILTQTRNNKESFDISSYKDPQVGDQICVTPILNGQRGTSFVKILDKNDINSLSGNTEIPERNNQISDQNNKTQSGYVNYINNYGVLLWTITDAGLVSANQYQSANSYVPYYGDYQIVDGIKYLHIANQNTLIQAQYLQNPKQLPEIVMPDDTVLVAGNVPYGIYLRDDSANMTNQVIQPETSWRVFAKKTFYGHTYYRIGNNQQWLEDTYVKSMS